MKKTMAGGEAPFRITKAHRVVTGQPTGSDGCSATGGDDPDKPPC